MDIIVVDKPKRIKLTSSMRRQLKKQFGETGYQRFLFANRIGLYGAIDFSNPFELEAFRHYLTLKV
jgi:hypothetical protein